LPDTPQSYMAAQPGSCAPSCNSNSPSHLSRCVPFCNNGPPARFLDIFLLLSMLYFFLIVRLLFSYSCQPPSSAVTRFPISQLSSKHIKVPGRALKVWVHHQLQRKSVQLHNFIGQSPSSEACSRSAHQEMVDSSAMYKVVQI
jgi:hypothetical protein